MNFIFVKSFELLFCFCDSRVDDKRLTNIGFYNNNLFHRQLLPLSECCGLQNTNLIAIHFNLIIIHYYESITLALYKSMVSFCTLRASIDIGIQYIQ